MISQPSTGFNTHPTSSSRELDVDAAVDFLRRLFVSEPERDELAGHLLIWTKNAHRKGKTSHWYHSLREVRCDLEANIRRWAELDVYFGICLSEPGMQKGKNLTARRRLKARGDENHPGAWYQPGMWADLDYGQEGHKADGKEYAPDEQTVLEKVRKMAIQPTIIVESGHGLQAHWLFENIMEAGLDIEAASNRSKAWNDTVRDSMAPHAVDSTWDMARLFRLPGTWNNKVPASPKQVRVIQDTGPFTTPEEIDRVLAERHQQPYSAGKSSNDRDTGY